MTLSLKNRLVDCIRPLSDTVTIANIRLFWSRQHKEKSQAVESHETGPYIILYTIYCLSSAAN